MSVNDRYIPIKYNARYAPKMTNPLQPVNEEVTFDMIQDNADYLVETLHRCGGDIYKFQKIFVGEIMNSPHQQGYGITVVTRALFTLNKPEHAKQKAEWSALVQAHEESKTLIARAKGFEFISSYTLPHKDKNVPISSYVAVSKFWLAGHNASETTKAKRIATDSPRTLEVDETTQILEDLKEE